MARTKAEETKRKEWHDDQIEPPRRDVSNYQEKTSVKYSLPLCLRFFLLRPVTLEGEARFVCLGSGILVELLAHFSGSGQGSSSVKVKEGDLLESC